ncbi:hypothetical protein [Megamonas sp.]|uniref:hypothetical protein n=1 Tax=Megamonas sp. TaxID=2049033 RepID=UPI00258CB061|nr:hypothetical protein [Megamonas sp.]
MAEDLGKDFMTKIAQSFDDDPLIKKYCDGRIRMYEISDAEEELEMPCIYLDPVGPSQETAYASNKALADEFVFQVSVESRDRLVTKAIQQRAKSIMREKFSFSQTYGGLDEYFSDSDKFVDARRYRGRSQIYDYGY